MLLFCNKRVFIQPSVLFSCLFLSCVHPFLLLQEGGEKEKVFVTVNLYLLFF